jgi:hypothetical protein
MYGSKPTYMGTCLKRNAFSQVCMEAEVMESAMAVGTGGVDTFQPSHDGQKCTAKISTRPNKSVQSILMSYGKAYAEKSRFATLIAHTASHLRALPKSKTASVMTSPHMSPPLWLARLTSAS